MPEARRPSRRGEADLAAEDLSAKPRPDDSIPGTEVFVNGQMVLKTSLGAAYTGCAGQAPQWEDVPVKVRENGSLRLPGQREIMIAHGQVVLDLAEPLSHARTISFEYKLTQNQAVLTSPDGLVRIRLKALSDAAYRIRSVQVKPVAAIVPGLEAAVAVKAAAAAAEGKVLTATRSGQGDALSDGAATRVTVSEGATVGADPSIRGSAAQVAAVCERATKGGAEGQAAGELAANGTVLLHEMLEVADESDSESEEEEEPEPEFKHGADDWLRVQLNLGPAGARKRAVESLLRLRVAVAVRDPTKLVQLACEAETEDERVLIMREKRSLEHEGYGRQYNAQDEQDDEAGALAETDAERQPRRRLREHDLRLTQIGLPPEWLQARNALAARRVKKAKQRSSQFSKEPRIEWRQYYAEQRDLQERQLLLQQRQGMPPELMHCLMNREGSPLGHAAHRLPLGIGLLDDAVTTTSPTRRGALHAEAESRGSETCDADRAELWRAGQQGCRASLLPALASGGRAEAGQVLPVNVLAATPDYRTHSPMPFLQANTTLTPGSGWANAASLAARVARSTAAVFIPASVVELSSPFSSGVARAIKEGGVPLLPRVTVQDLELFDPKNVHFAQAVGGAKERAAEWPGALNGPWGEYTDGSPRLPHIGGTADGLDGGSTTGRSEPWPPRLPPPRVPMMRPTSRPASPTPMASRSVKSEPVPLEPPGLPAEHWPHVSPRVQRSIQEMDIAEEEALFRAWEKHRHAQAANSAARAGAEKRAFKPSPTVTPRVRAAAKAARTPAVSTAELECALRSVLPAHRVEELLEGARAAPAGAHARALLDDWGPAHGAFPVHLSSISPRRRPRAVSPHPSPHKWALGGPMPLWAQSQEKEEQHGGGASTAFV